MDYVSCSPSTSVASEGGRQPASGDLTGKTLADFQVLRLLGQGGMGQVYLAEQLSLKRKVALKILKSNVSSDPVTLQRFKAEAEAVAQATDPHIVQVYAIGEQDGLHYMALEFVEGCNLREYLLKKGPPELALALSVMRQVTTALERAGERGIIHRDIKPENILLTRKGEVKVADFGLSRCYAGDRPPLNLTQSGVIMGTPLYMSPEQVQGHPLDSRTDVYSFGVTCYHMLTGSPPFQGPTAFEVALLHVQGQARPLHEVRPDLPEGLCAIVDKMMAKKPEDRYQSAAELHQDLSRFRSTLTKSITHQYTPIAVPTQLAAPVSVTPTRRIVAPSRRRWLGWTAAATIVAAMMAGGVFGWITRKPKVLSTLSETRPAEPAAEETAAHKREKLLTEALPLYENPKKAEEINLGLGQRLDLALLYLDQWRLDDAGRFFDQLAFKSKVKAYRLLGQIGEAVVLAFRDQAVESVQKFVQVLGDKKVDRWFKIRVVNRNPRFRQKIADAMERNISNQALVPPALRELAWPRPLQMLQPAGSSKAGRSRRRDGSS